MSESEDEPMSATLQDKRHAKHLAYQIVSQLPEDEEEALMVLSYARKLILQPMDEGEPVAMLRLVESR